MKRTNNKTGKRRMGKKVGGSISCATPKYLSIFRNVSRGWGVGGKEYWSIFRNVSCDWGVGGKYWSIFRNVSCDWGVGGKY